MSFVESGRCAGSLAERRVWWRGHVVAQSGSVLSGAAYCRAHGLCAKSFYRWHRVLMKSGELARVDTPSSGGGPARARGGGPLFAEVVVQTTVGEAALEVVLGHGRRVRVHPGFDEATLARIVAVLERSPC